MKKSSIVIIILLILSFNSLAYAGGIRGHVQYPARAEKLPQPEIILVGQDKWQTSDSTGEFAFDSLSDGTYFVEFASSFDFYGRIFMKVTISGDSVAVLNIEFPDPCLPNLDSICPICGKLDNVIPVIYGKPTGELMDEAEDGKVILAGCLHTDCSPLWYCKLDKVRF